MLLHPCCSTGAPGRMRDPPSGRRTHCFRAVTERPVLHRQWTCVGQGGCCSIALVPPRRPGVATLLHCLSCYRWRTLQLDAALDHGLLLPNCSYCSPSVLLNIRINKHAYYCSHICMNIEEYQASNIWYQVICCHGANTCDV